MSSFFNKFSKRKTSIDKSSLGSNSSLFSSGTTFLSPYSVNEKQLPQFLKAVWKNDLSKVKKLIKKSYNTIDQEKRSGFHLACAAGHFEIIKELISNYSNELLEKRDLNNKTGMFKAVEKGILENVQYIFEKGAKTDVKDDKGDSLLHAAIRHKHSSILKYLLDKELNPNDLNNDENTPLHVASELNFIDGIKLLMNYSCYVDAQNKLGKTALILATESGNENVIKMLLSNNANLDIKDNEGYKALHYASFHQRIECKKLLQQIEDQKPQVSPPKRPSTLEAPEFISKLAYDNQKSQKSANSKRTSSNDAVKSRIPISDKQNQARKSISQDSIHSNSSWMGDFASTSSDATIPASRNTIAIHDISTPSSMMNPSDNIVGKIKSVSPGFDNSNLKNEISDDEESQWSENEKSVKEEIAYSAVLNKPVERKTEADNKNSESEWDSEDTEQQNVGIELSTIDEESGDKRENEKSELSLPYVDDGHQTDSNIEECYKTNYIITTNPPIRYDNVDALDMSIDEDSDEDVLNELCTTQVVNTKYKDNSPAPSSKPPKSPGVYSSEKNIPTINVQDVTPKKRTHYLNQAGGDNLSYSSTEFDVNSRNGSLAESDSLTDFKKCNRKSIDEYIKKCTHLESKLRSFESENDCLHMNINAINSSKEKLESERLKLHAENQKLESQLSERIEELEEFKAKFIGAEDQLKKREKELFEIKKSKQEIEDKYNQIEINNIALNSKVKQLTQEMEDIQSQHHENLYDGNGSIHETFLQKTNAHLKNKILTIEEDSLKYKKQHEEELKNLSTMNDNLKSQILNLQTEISKKQESYSLITSENKKKSEDFQKEIENFTQTIQKEKEDKENLQEEIDQLKKTIKNLNTDLESSNKSTALVKKQERENRELKDRIQELEKNCSQLHVDIENTTKLSLDKEQKISTYQIEVDRLKNQLNLKDDNMYHLETQYKTYESQSKDLEKILERKNSELRENENKLLHFEIELKKEIKKNEDALNTINDAINTVINDYPDSSELLEKLQNIRKAINSSDGNTVNIHKPVNLSRDDKDLFIELSKSKSQIKVLEEQIEQMKQNYHGEIRSFANKQNSYEETSNDIENERIDKLEIIERQLHSDLQSKSRLIQTNQHELTQLDKEISQLKEALKEEKHKYQLIQEKDKSLSNQLRNEIKKRKQLSEAMDSVKYWLDKYGKQFNLSSHKEEFTTLSNSDTVDNVFSSVPNECSLLLQTVFDRNDDLKMKLKKTELELLELNNQKSSSEKCQEFSNENAQVLLNHQLEEMTQIMENQRLNREKLEKIRDENEFQLRNELYQLKQQTMIEVSQFTNKSAAIEEERERLFQQNKNLNEALIKERQLKDSLTEQLVNLVKTSQGSNQHLNGYESAFHANNFGPSLSQFSIPISLIDNERKGYANSMLNLSVFKQSGIEEDDLRQKLRQELDRSIAKHLESGKPIRQLNIREKIRSLNGGRYPNGIVSWKSP